MAANRRPYVSVFFRCCRVYQRVYRRPGVARYTAYCPRCLGRLEIRVDPEGTDERFFEADR